KKGGIPVFTNIPGDAKRGALFDIGADYFELGKLTGQLAAYVLRGTDPATVPIKNLIPRQLIVNRAALNGLKDPWQLPPDLLSRANVIVDSGGAREVEPTEQIDLAAELGIHPPVTRRWSVNLIQYVNVLDSEEATQALLDGFKQA